MSGAPGNKDRGSDGSKNKDHLFDPTVDMMVDDYDDERTLDEEEALAAGEAEDPHAELSSLQREGDMPLEELLALYGYGADSQGGLMAGCESQDAEPDKDSGVSELERTSGTHPDVEVVTQRATEQPTSPPPPPPPPPAEPSVLHQLYEPMPPDTPDAEQEGSRLLRSVSRSHSEADVEEEDDDYDYSPDEDEWKKTIMVGNDYQASIPEGLCSYDDALPYENEDKLLWDPNPLDEEQVEEYLKCVSTPIIPGAGVAAIPCGSHLKDDEQALYLLLQCGHNIEEALRRRRINAITSTDTMSLWSEEECRNFETGIRVYGKDFHLIQQNKVRTRSVGELVQFYYLWKKTERHDAFANKARLDKKKYTLHPGLTDFMDRFLEDQEGTGSRDRSSSPGVHCIIYNDSKKSIQTGNELIASTASKVTELQD